jgi:alkyldihydroxyacetonephosphate synthase
VWPEDSAQVQAIVAAAHLHNVVIIPFGGGTTVSGAVLCPEGEQRMIVSLDTSKMNRILYIDKTNMVARIEAGVRGEALELKLAEFGVCTGHAPDSYEFSTLGGWVATRASGMKKNIYGNIEDMLVRAQLVTPTGTLEKQVQVPRMSAGPDVNQLILGSEGTLGVVTEATLKIRNLPEAVLYNSAVFPDFESGVGFMIEVALKRLQPASVRLIDNEQFEFGHALRPEETGLLAGIMSSIKTFYVTKVKGFDPKKLAVATLLFEGGKEQTKRHEAEVLAIAHKHGAITGGEENGKRGYLLTFVIAYLRDIAFDYHFIAESFETSLPLSCVKDLCRNVKDRIRSECVKEGVQCEPYASCRVTQLYDNGACVYFYFGFLYHGLADPLATFHRIEVACREECLANGGSISHHHGVGKTRARWLEGTNSKLGVDAIKAVKAKLDPKDIFAVGNLFPQEGGSGLH